jgi:hypothetical protein
MKLETLNSYITNPQFTGGVMVTPISGSAFASASGDFPQWGFNAAGLYVGDFADLVVKTYDGSVLMFASASGFIPGIICAVSASSVATNIIALK